MELVVHLQVLPVTHEVDDFDYGLAKSKTSPPSK